MLNELSRRALLDDANIANPPIMHLLREQGVRNVLGGVGRTTLWRWIREGRFPKPVRLGANCVAWRSDEVEAWLASRPRYDESEAVA